MAPPRKVFITKLIFQRIQRAIYRRPKLREIYWWLRAPFSPYASVAYTRERIARSLYTDGSARIVLGPFSGMAYTRHGSSVSLPSLLGTYEMEIWPFLAEVRKRKYDILIDVGCAEGYYACGLARMLGIQMLAFDIDPSSRMDCEEMVGLNGLQDLVRVDGLLTHQRLEEITASSYALLFCDIEGGEADLLDPKAIPSLSQTDMIVEIHGEANENTEALLRERFKTTHDVYVESIRQRSICDLIQLLESESKSHFQKIGDEALAIALLESRTYNAWMMLSSRASNSKSR